VILATRADIPKARVHGTHGGGGPLTLPELAIDGRHWRNSGRIYVPRWLSHLSALRPDRSEDDWREYFAWAIATGFEGARVFAGFLGDWASGQTAESARARLSPYLDAAAACGLAVEVTALTGTADGGYDPREHVDIIASKCAGRPNVVLELGNELYHGSQAEYMLDPDFLAELRHIARAAGFAGPIAYGAFGADEPLPDGTWPYPVADYSTVHLDRGRPFWEQARRVREIYSVSEATGAPALDNEPLGAAEKNGDEYDPPKQRSNDPAFFSVLGALDRGFSGVGGVHHSEAGREAVLPGPVQQRCAEAYVAAHRAVADIVGEDIPAYRNAGHTDSPVLSFAAGGAVRCYSFTVGDRGATVGVGVTADPGIVWGNGFAPVAVRYEEVARDSRALRVYEVRR
jgi:hypothetical protein